jgi:two-component system, OmpR family, phosphate regulon sensor histidine kinase PhoR
MKRRIRTIFILMTLCILGIYVFQAYWLYNTYSVHQQQFMQTAVDALLTALEKRQAADARLLFRGSVTTDQGGQEVSTDTPGVATPWSGIPWSGIPEQPDKKEERVIYRRLSLPDSGPDRVFVVNEEQNLFHVPGADTVTQKVKLNVITFQRQGLPDSITRVLSADSLASRISRRIMYDWADTPFHLHQMNSVYRAELKLRNVETDFRLDTLQLRPLKAGVSAFEEKQYVEYPVQLHPVPVNPVRNLFIQASFQKPVPYILSKMSWLLLGSFVLLVLTTGCFLYMLFTILRQKKLSEIKNDFINNMTHELKTPLATVSAAVEAMQAFGALNDAQKTQLYLQVSRNELQRLSDLVEKVLHMAVEEKGELSLAIELINPNELIQEIVEQHRMKATKSVDFILDASSDPTWIRADRLHMGNTIHNLIDNAIKYSPEPVTIRINSRGEPQGWRFSIADNGIGIPKMYQQAIFERFFRVPTGNLHQVKGFGLGLAYVRQVVEKHGGCIEVHSEVAQGCEFVLWLPAERNNF